MKYFHTITPISDERRENRKNEIDAYINDIKKQLFSLYCEKASLDIKAEDYVGKNFKFNFNPYHYAIIDIKGIDAVIDSDDTKKKYPSPLYKTSSVTVIRYKKKLYKIKAF